LSKIFIRVRPLLLLLKWIASRIKSDDSNVGWRYKVKAFARVISSDIYANHRNWRMVFADWEIAQLLSVGESTLPMISRKYESRADLSVIENCMLMDIEEWLECDVLQKTDQGSMMNSLEFRAPFLHPEVIGYTLKLPLSRKINFFQQKVILREILGQRSNLNLWPKKKGFGAPISEWIMTHPSNFRTQIALNSNLNQAFVDDLFARHIAREEDNSFKIYTLLVITLWEKEACEVLV
jgi:asparagine synthetase B (glutamine-hydrolysing)